LRGERQQNENHGDHESDEEPDRRGDGGTPDPNAETDDGEPQQRPAKAEGRGLQRFPKQRSRTSAAHRSLNASPSLRWHRSSVTELDERTWSALFNAEERDL
jgi:hypothetical protein